MPGSTPFLPYGRHNIGDDDIAAVGDVLRSDFLATGPAMVSFENALAESTGSGQAVSCSSGTAALHLAALALKLGPDDTIIVPSVTFLATANAARYAGADVTFADVDPDTGLMRPEDLIAALERTNAKARAVFPVHLAGQSPDMPALSDIAKSSDLAIVEDASHALGTTYRHGNRDYSVGSCGHSDMATFSFHPVKTIAMGEGGAITANDPELIENLRLYRNHGMTRNAEAFVHPEMACDAAGKANPWYYEMQDIGFNYRASDIHCALGLSQLGKLEQFAERRKQLVTLYDRALADLAPLLRPIRRVANCDPVWHLYSVLIDFQQAGLDRATLMRQLQERGIGSQVHYIPVHRQPYYRDLYGNIDLPGADAYYARCLSLPLFPAMSDDDVDRVVRELTSLLGAF